MSSTMLKQVKRFWRALLHEYQNHAVEFLKHVPFCALWIDMGLGKSVSSLTGLVDMFNEFEIGKVLIIAPKRVSIDTWPEQIEQWEHTKHLTYTVLAGLPPKQREAALIDGSDIHILNRENVPWLVKQWGQRWPYDTVVIDESSSFKSSKSQRFKALKKVRGKMNRMIQLTGTPSSNGLLDLWSQVYLLDQGERLGKTFTAYKEKYFTCDYMGYNFTPKPGAEKEIHAKLKDICLTLSAKDYLDLPERIDNMIGLDLTTKQRQQYKTLEKEFLLQLEEETVTAFNAATLSGKLLQFANGALYIDDQRNWEEVHTAKLDALEEIFNESNGNPILVAYNYKSDLARLKNRFFNAEAIGDNKDTIKRWNKGEIRMLLAHPASAGHGLNLQQGGHVAVWFGLNWSLELYLQFNARLDRQGQTKPVIIHHLVIRDSIDETVLRALETKNTTQQSLLNALKKDITKRAA